MTDKPSAHTSNRKSRLRILMAFVQDNFLEKIENADMTKSDLIEKMIKFYRQQAATIENFDRTKNTMHEDIESVLYRMGLKND